MKIEGRWFSVFLNQKSSNQISGFDPSAKFMAKRLTAGRLGISVSKKILKLAADRNKIKRRVRAIVRESALDLAEVCHIKVVVKPGGASQKFSDMKSDLAAAFQMARKRITGL